MIIKKDYIKRIKIKKVANATPTDSIVILKTPTDFKEPKKLAGFLNSRNKWDNVV